MRTLVSCVVTLILCQAGSATAGAQVIRGRVIDSLSSRPVTAGFVVLLNAADQEVFRALTDAGGRFAIQAEAGEYRLRSERIGYRAWVSRPFTLDVGETIERDIRISTIPTRLSAITVTGSARCRQGSLDAENTATVWEEARKALAAAAWTLDRRVFEYTLNMYERELDRLGRRVQHEERRTSGGYTRTPFRAARPAHELARDGYIVANADGSWTYEAPDANVLLSDTFLATHCFSVTRAVEDRERYIGLAFEPVDRRGGSDIGGTLWLDEETSELRRLDYRYTNLPYDMRSDRLGGGIEFMRVATGAWVIREWEIRMPTIEIQRTRLRDEARLVAIHAAGGRVVEVKTAVGEQLYSVPGTLTGTVYDSTRSRPLVGAVVRLVGEADSVTVDRRGRFEIISNLNGAQRVTVRHPRLDSIGLAIPATPVIMSRGDTVQVVVAIPSVATLHMALCPDSSNYLARLGRNRVLWGVVRDAKGTSLAGVEVAVEWRGSARRLTTDAAGRYVACGVPLNQTVVIEARHGERSSGSVSLRFSSNRVRDGEGTVHRLDVPIWRYDLQLEDSVTPP